MVEVDHCGDACAPSWCGPHVGPARLPTRNPNGIHQGLQVRPFGALPRRQKGGQGHPASVAHKVDFGRQTTPRASNGLARAFFREPSFRGRVGLRHPRSSAAGANAGRVDHHTQKSLRSVVDKTPLACGLDAERLQDEVEQSACLPLSESMLHGLPKSLLQIMTDPWQVAPSGTEAENPENLVQDGPVAAARASHRRVGKQILNRPPLRSVCSGA